MEVVKLTQLGVERVLKGAVGMTFCVDSFTPAFGGGKPNAHVRDYRCENEPGGYAIWSLGPDDYEVIPAKVES